MLLGIHWVLCAGEGEQKPESGKELSPRPTPAALPPASPIASSPKKSRKGLIGPEKPFAAPLPGALFRPYLAQAFTEMTGTEMTGTEMTGRDCVIVLCSHNMHTRRFKVLIGTLLIYPSIDLSWLI
jgi:hypothetical protein